MPRDRHKPTCTFDRNATVRTVNEENSLRFIDSSKRWRSRTAMNIQHRLREERVPQHIGAAGGPGLPR